jgi:hypothetical protein
MNDIFVIRKNIDIFFLSLKGYIDTIVNLEETLTIE